MRKLSRILSVIAKLAAVYFVIAIALGRMNRDSEFSKQAAKDDFQPVRIERVNNDFRILTQLPPGKIASV